MLVLVLVLVLVLELVKKAVTGSDPHSMSSEESFSHSGPWLVVGATPGTGTFSFFYTHTRFNGWCTLPALSVSSPSR